MLRIVVSAVALCTVAGALDLIARHSDLPHAWAVAGGVLALLAWIVFERLSRR